jgi:transposase-like protein
MTTEPIVEQGPVAGPAGQVSDEQLVAMLVDRARGDGLKLTGEGGLLQQLTKRVLESALEGEITDHVGYDKHDSAGQNSGNSRNGHRAKTVITDVGPVEVRVPRDVAGSFEPQIVRKRQRRLSGVDDLVLSLSAKGLTHGEIAAHLAEVYGTEVSKQTISTITDKVMDGMAEWQNRPLDRGQVPSVVANHVVACWRCHCRMIWLGVLSFRHSRGRSLSSAAIS